MPNAVRKNSCEARTSVLETNGVRSDNRNEGGKDCSENKNQSKLAQSST